MKPLLIPALRRLWRDSSTLQLGVDPEDAVVITDLDPASALLLSHLDGRHSRHELAAFGAKHDLSPAEVDDLILELSRAGALLDGEPSEALPTTMTSEARRLLTSELAALSLREREPGAILGQRLDARIIVHTTGRIGPAIAALLAASGIGRIHLTDGHRPRQVAQARDALPAGIQASDEGRPFLTAARDAVLRANPSTSTRRLARDTADIAVLADEPAHNPASAIAYFSNGIPHLPVSFWDARAVIGPLVIPGQTACVTCKYQYVTQAEPTWPALAAQLATGEHPSQPIATTVAAAAAAVAAAQVLCLLAGGSPAALNGCLELDANCNRLFRRPCPPHPDCGCVRSPRPEPASAD